MRVQYWAAARDAAGVEAEEVPAGALGEVLAAVAAAHPRLVPILRVCSVFVDGEQVTGAGHRAVAGADAVAVVPTAGRPTDRGPELAGGSTVEILPPFAGG